MIILIFLWTLSIYNKMVRSFSVINGVKHFLNHKWLTYLTRKPSAYSLLPYRLSDHHIDSKAFIQSSPHTPTDPEWLKISKREQGDINGLQCANKRLSADQVFNE